MKGKIVIIGTLDTKGKEILFIKNIIEGTGVSTIVMNTGVIGGASWDADISNETVAHAGGASLQELVAKDDRGYAMDVMMRGAAAIMTELYRNKEVAGVISLGGSAGTTIGTYAMQALPVGVPKLMVSTVASGNTRPYVGEKDITMMYSVVDISGINRLSANILANAAYAIAGMAKGVPPQLENKSLIAATMFGVTTPCVNKAREYLEQQGYEVLVFHATGSGGMAMEALIESGFIEGVLDVTTTEWCDELAGGVLSAGASRLEAAAKAGIPQVVSTGALDMVNFGAMDTVPEKYAGRNLYKHNATITLMRTNVEENRQLGQIIASKLNRSTGPCALFLPLKGVSLIDNEGQPFYGPEEDAALFDALRTNLDRERVELVEMEHNVNDEAFALAMAKKLIELMKK
ncbi:Tm-1-like ATP-binding domain-containing protein [Paenibacillus ehimensis]|uniref:Tm-1-like ATP-binding domain-containing protein n=1 Tax=Paenibacillus ehimensis TaxID=79264 RepID=A0ABT8VG62_9BACL|nr:Tm-1-like ATP-binding domain-containing protein [Paenibacillus ehimensis]MDO3679984.1 Tm-1-like ATP-binding domain-containing protein [Paenibacillus ehimensis]MEC0213463.1 Tm-1-like ATP-binding domain-containing protein [Paenibacillus ehimensis]